MIVPIFDLKSFLVSFTASPVASFVTNGHGFILEANLAAGKLFHIDDHLTMKSKRLVSFAHRKSTNALHALISDIYSKDEINADKIEMRPRSSDSFQSNIYGKVICRSNMIVLIHWEIKDMSMCANSHELAATG